MGDEFDESQTGLEGSVVLVAIRIVHAQGGCPDAEAIERAAPDRTNKGWEAALAAIEMALFARRLSASRQEDLA